MKELQDYTIGIIGFGNFGKVVAEYLFPKNNILVYSVRKEQRYLFPTISFLDSIQDLVEKSDIIIPAVPIRHFASVIEEISTYINPDQIVMDICSVKEYPVEIMKKYLDNKAHIIAAHPMFGPNSIKQRNNNLKGLHIVISNVACIAILYDQLKNYFTSLELNVIEMSPREHDNLSAHSQFFTMMIGQMAQKLQLRHTPIDTPAAAAIFDALSYMGPDRHIIEDMITYNVYCRTILMKMIDTLEELKKQSL